MDDENGTTIKDVLLKNPLFLPPGSVRAIIGLVLVVGTVYAYLASGTVPEGLATLTAAVVVFYYKSKE